jgi:hypothetical protein
MAILVPASVETVVSPDRTSRPGGVLLLWLTAIVTVATVALGWLPRRGAVRFEVGGATDVLRLEGPWSPAFRQDIDPQAAADDTLSYYCRTARHGAGIDLPLEALGQVRIGARARAVVRSSVTIYCDRQALGQVVVDTRRWDVVRIDEGEQAPAWRPLRLELALRPVALVAGDHASQAAVLVDWIEVASTGGIRLAPAAALRLAFLPLGLAAFAWLVGAGPGMRAASTVVGAAAALAASYASPLMADAALSRLVPMAFLAGVAAWGLLKGRAEPRGDPSLVACVVLVGTLGHGLVVFFPNHNPPDLSTHIGRTMDFGTVPLEYEALLRYGSHLPTASQRAAPATDLFGSKALVPYAPGAYLVLYGLARAGLELQWLATALVAALAMLVAVPLFLTARTVWDRHTAWLAVALYTLDLPVWHHVGRAHLPASAGQALATMALLLLVRRPLLEDRRGGWLGPALLLAAAALGYTSQVVLLGLFGLILLALLVVDAGALDGATRRGLALCVVAGGAVALLSYYGHYIPGLLRQAGPLSIEAEPEVFSGRTVLGVFRNEGRQSYRIWALGFTAPFLVGLACAPFALARARAAARPLLVAWLAAWGLLAVLKDPVFFPVTLRWAKEDQFLSPLLALLTAAAVSALRARGLRRLAAVTVTLLAAVLQGRDYLLHAATNLW